MKVSTDLKAGNSLLEQAQSQAGAAASQVTNLVSNANQQAQGITTGLVNKTTAFWNCLTGS